MSKDRKRDSDHPFGERKTKVPKFPCAQQTATLVFKEGAVSRDNSKFLKVFMENTSMVFMRPMQLGKTTLFSLAQLSFSSAFTAPEGLQYDPTAEVKNNCYVLRVDFMPTTAAAHKYRDQWQEIGKLYDASARLQVLAAVDVFLMDHGDIGMAGFDCNVRIQRAAANLLANYLEQSVVSTSALYCLSSWMSTTNRFESCSWT